MNGLVSLINHPAVPWGGGGMVGGIVGLLAGQPHCLEVVDGRLVLGCVDATLPILNAPADVATFMAVFTVAGAVVGAMVGFVAPKLNL